MSTTYYATALDSWTRELGVTMGMITRSSAIDGAHIHRIFTGENLPSIEAFTRIYGALSFWAAVKKPKLLDVDCEALDRCHTDLFTAWSLDWGNRGHDRRARRS